MIALVVLALLSWTEQTGVDYIDGMAAYMDRGVMETVIRNRRLAAGAEGCAALMRRGDLGRTVWLEYAGEIVQVTVCDCAQSRHYDRRVAQGDVAEVSYQQALRWGMVGVGRVPVRVWFLWPDSDQARRIRRTWN